MTTDHKPDPEFVEYLENQVKNPFLSAATVMQMERVFIDQREKYEAMLTPARMANEMWEKTMMEVIGEDGIASVADAIRILQVRADNAIPKCDGNHGGAPCRDRECWNDEGVYPFNGAQAASETPVDHLTILKRLNEATRQYRHNTDDDSGFVFAYDRHEIDGLVADLVATNSAWKAAREQEGGEAVARVTVSEAPGGYCGAYVGIEWLDEDRVIEGDLLYRGRPKSQGVPEGWRSQVEKALSLAKVFDDGSDGADGESAASVVSILTALLSTPAAPQADEWVKCEDRLPTPRNVSRTAKNGILVKFDNGRITQFREVSETLISNMRNGPRQPMKFESPNPAGIVEWMDLDESPQPPEQGDGV